MPRGVEGLAPDDGGEPGALEIDVRRCRRRGSQHRLWRAVPRGSR